jgi:uncharacterized protein (DUF2249 family)
MVVQKLLLNFQMGGHLLKIYYHNSDPLITKITNKFHPNYQLPMWKDCFDQEELWKLKIKRLKNEDMNQSYNQAKRFVE